MCSRTLHFEKITPTDDAQIEIYSEALDFVFINRDLKNIAMTGSYGAGKSSVLESYKKRKRISFLHISLAHFEASYKNEIESSVDDFKQKETMLEGKILNQLLHQIPPSNIPLSLFKIKTKTSAKSTLWFTLAILVLIGLILYFSNFNNNCQWIETICLNNNFNDEISTICCYTIPTIAIIFLVLLSLLFLRYCVITELLQNDISHCKSKELKH
jgi:hypothetical protein